jgi:Rrf2 family nitric oxide-sensitive transcriptional repressor
MILIKMDSICIIYKMQVKYILFSKDYFFSSINIYTKYCINFSLELCDNFITKNIQAMRLTAYTDYTLRTLMHLAINQDHLVTIQDIADLHSVSKNHLMKVVHQLGLSGMVDTVRGRNGGLKLSKDPKQINIGEVVRNSESDFFMAECFDHNDTCCAYASACALKGVLSSATAAYLAVLDGVTLEDLISKKVGVAGLKAKSSPIHLHAKMKQT